MNNKLIIISSPSTVSSEIKKVVSLLKLGLQQFHVRKPNFDDFDMMNYITSIPKEYRKYLVLHSHYHLAKEFNLKGIQVGKNRVDEAKEYKNNFSYFGYSAHSISEITKNKENYSHFFLSPIYNSISKAEYKANFTSAELSAFLQNNTDINIVALGGIDENNSKECFSIGFKGIALLGAIWQQTDVLIAFNKIQKTLKARALTLSIAGFDPSSGAGITADIKTCEQHKVQGLGVNTAITYQNESEFLSVDWLSFEQIKKQIDVLFAKYKPTHVKIGLIESFEILKQVILVLKAYNKSVKIIWDPILKASANFNFHNTINRKEIFDLLKDIYLATPNLHECDAIFGTTDINVIQLAINDFKLCNVLVKGGHSINDDVSDVLIEQNNITHFEGKRLVNKDKHGTGCVLSSAICSNLANELSLQASIKIAKNYVTNFIDSSNKLLGFHNI